MRAPSEDHHPMCGYIGIVGPQPVAADLYEGLLTLQHRGQDAAGFCTWDGGFKLVKGGGLVDDVFTPEAAARLTGNMGVAQVRYPTVGYGGPDDAQPFLVSSPLPLAMAHNGNVTNC
ncbi:MAG: amidophosphoribosyltransferase, partial [Planctomycetota bacterium]